MERFNLSLIKPTKRSTHFQVILLTSQHGVQQTSSALYGRAATMQQPQGEPKYFEVGTTLTFEPDVSAVPQPINSIRWKYGSNLVVDWDLSGSTYYGSFNGRTTLDPQTLRLVINRLTLADNGYFSLETNLGTVRTHEVKVI
ncbi:unnamed protein product, partial [Boreogadus saida]